MTSLILPRQDGSLEEYRLQGTPIARPDAIPRFNRIAYAAAHVVSDPLSDADPWGNPAIDWEATMAFRHHLWSLGFRIAEAMDTAQRGMGLSWPGAQELIRRSLAEARSVPGADLACGAGTDQLAPADARSIEDVIAAYEEQIGFVEAHGGRAIMMASRALARVARSAGDYRRVYGHILAQAKDKVVLHWLGDMFDPQLTGYWGSSDLGDAMAVCLDIIRRHRDKVDGIKVSLLDAELEIELRARLPAGVRMYTGDDFNYDRLILGDGRRFSDALLGIFDAIAPAASAALQALDRGDVSAYRDILGPTVPLSRHIFERPTYAYKTGIVFLAWLAGHQPAFTMVGGLQSDRSVVHLAEDPMGRKVAIIGHSQGALEARWAVRWWPDLRRVVSEAVAAPNRQAEHREQQQARACEAWYTMAREPHHHRLEHQPRDVPLPQLAP